LWHGMWVKLRGVLGCLGCIGALETAEADGPLQTQITSLF